MTYDKITRWLHAGMALGITWQLLSSLAMEIPKPGVARSALEAAAFKTHELVGISVLMLMLVHWLWQFSGHLPKGFGRLFPWFSAQGRKAVLGAVRQLVRLKPDNLQQSDCLAGGIHGLGLLAATAMAASGGVLYFGLGENGTMSPAVHAIAEFHSFMATFMWIFLIGHTVMAIVHQWLGHHTLSDMFDFKR